MKAVLNLTIAILLSKAACPSAEAAPLLPREVMLPLTCQELLPEAEPYRNFFEAVARGAVTSNPKLSKRMFRILSLRQKLSDSDKRNKEENPIDVLIRRALCFYRESRDPARAVPYDDNDFLKYLLGGIGDLERKVDEIVYEAELERLQREEYEKRLDRNRDLIEQLRQEADQSAQRTFENQSRKARRKLNSQ